MATLYRFIVENRQRSTGEGRTPKESTGPKGAAKKGKMVSIFSGSKGGVEHNRKMRAINPLLNKASAGYWEKGMRVSRAGMGLIQKNTETGKLGVSGVSIAILIQMVLLALLKWQQRERQKAEKLNSQNFKQLENGVGAVHGEYKISTNLITGRQTYNQNK